MIITYHGELFLKLQTGDTVIAVNPIAKDSGKKVTRFGADICLVSAKLPICNGFDQVTLGGKELFVINSPGEYEKNGITFKAIESTFDYLGETKINTSFVFNFDNMKVCVLGIVQQKLPAEVRDEISSCDILILPLLEGENFSYLSPSLAESVAVSLEAKIVIPVGYNEKTLPIFLKEAGATNVLPIEKLTIKKKDLENKDGEVITLHEI
jgi:hypothetical protein